MLEDKKYKSTSLKLNSTLGSMNRDALALFPVSKTSEC